MKSFVDTWGNNNSLAHFAVELRNTNLMNFLLTEVGEIEVNQMNKNGDTPLHLCCNKDFFDTIEIARMLLLNGADPTL